MPSETTYPTWSISKLMRRRDIVLSNTKCSDEFVPIQRRASYASSAGESITPIGWVRNIYILPDGTEYPIDGHNVELSVFKEFGLYIACAKVTRTSFGQIRTFELQFE